MFGETLNLNWVMDNLLSEIIFGVLFIGVAAFCLRYIRDLWRATRIVRIISIHNGPTRTRRKGIHARDRFMDVYEAKVPLVSRKTAYCTGFIEGVWCEEYLDKGILELHGLVTVKETVRGITTEANTSRVVKWVYRLCKSAEERERRQTEQFILEKSGRRRKIPQ